MSRRIYRIILALLTVALISALFLLNPQATEVHLGRGVSYTLPMALILILTFVSGAILAFLLAFVSQFQLSWAAWREKRLRSAERAHLKELIVINELITLDNYQEASVKLSQILKEDPDNTLARSLLASCQDKLGLPSVALRTLEEGRSRVFNSSELYLKAAQIYMDQMNWTAALDNISLILRSHPNSRKVLTKGVIVAENLNDLDRAIQFQETLLRAVNSNEYQATQNKLADLELRNIKKMPRAIQPESLSRLLKKHRNFSPAYEFQAELDLQRGETELACRSYLRGFELSGNVDILAKIALLWLKIDNPEKAVRHIKSALRDKDSTSGHAYLYCLMAALGMTEEVRKELSHIDDKQSLLLQLTNILISERDAQRLDQLANLVKETILSELSEPIRESLRLLGTKKSASKDEPAYKEQPSHQLSVP